MTTVFYSRQCMTIEMQTGKQMKRDCFVHLQKLPLSFYNQTSVGYLLARVMSDTSRLCGMISWGAIGLIWNLCYLIGILIAMFALSPKMALTVLCVVPLVLIVTLVFQPKLLRANARMRHANSRMTGSYNENISGAKTSKTLVIEEQNCEEFDGVAGDMYRASLRSARLTALYLPIISFLGSTAVALVLWRSGVLVLQNALDFGILSAFISYGLMILDPLSQIASMFAEFMAVQVNLERVSALLDEPCTLDDTDEVKQRYGDVFDPKPEAYPPMRGEIEFDHVWFRYPDAAEDDYVLEDICLHIPAGTTVALVGETGAGKSTMVNLVCRFFEPTRGRVLIDGVDSRERSLGWLHANLGYVQQTPHLFSGSLRENIRYGRLDATDEEIERAAKLIAADGVAAKLENGYDTDVGEGGDRLSTGEKQLVSFARAVVADPPLFILDEATSSIDTETEHLIQNAIDHVLTGRTSFIIAHRLSTIRNADLILLVNDRGIAEQGSHEELMAKHGQYYELYTAMTIRDAAEKSGFAVMTEE
jgi:ATP-binding cassette subfamily B protein